MLYRLVGTFINILVISSLTARVIIFKSIEVGNDVIYSGSSAIVARLTKQGGTGRGSFTCAEFEVLNKLRIAESLR